MRSLFIGHSLSGAFRRLAWSNMAAQGAQQLGMAAALLAAVLVLNADVADIGILQIAQTLPFLLFSIPAGVLADRSSRRGVMRSGELLRALSLIFIPLATMTGWMNLTSLVLASFAGTLGAVAYSAALPALVPALVNKENLATANSRIELARSTAYISGPALAGTLVAWSGVNEAFGLAAILSLIAVLMMSRLPEPERQSRPDKSFMAELREGAVFVWRHQLLRSMLNVTVFFNIGFFVLQTAYIPYAAHVMGLSAADIGLTLAAYGVGMAIAAVAAAPLARKVSSASLLAIGPASGLIGSSMLLATIWMPTPWLAAACYFLMGMGPVLWTVASTTMRQVVTPQQILGRVSAINTMAVYGARPAGAIIAGAASRLIGMESCLWIASAVFLLPVLLIFFTLSCKQKNCLP